ncbi:MAG: MFS transporter, partial [Muribaculaceae bacterium]|nr:MFS transporter [Muribaculaceae bacterium]
MFKNHPKGLIPAALSNMGERFGYYIMNAVLLLFLCSKFGLSDSTAGVIYSVFYTLIYILSLVGGIIADRTRNYRGTIRSGLIIMAIGYAMLSVPILATADNQTWLLTFTCIALLVIALGNGLFKGNLQAIVGQMYDNLEAEAAKKGSEALAAVKGKRDSGFQIFYVFINIGGLVAPFIAPYLREWWLGVNNLLYNAELPALCHQFIDNAAAMTAEASNNLNVLAAKVSGGAAIGDMGEFCNKYLDVFNTGVHYSFIASVCAMLLSLAIFIFYQKQFPTPAAKEASKAADYTPEERVAMAKEIKQRLYALSAVLGI